MKNIFRPKLILDKYSDFDIDKFRSEGYNTLLLDVDNTITPYYQKIPDEKGKEFVRKLKEKGFRVIVFSNNTDKRVRPVAEALDAEYYCWALKPLKLRFNKVIKEKKLDRTKVICMGDQLLTDVWGANRAKVYSIYVKPIINSDSFITSINRKIERFIFKNILHEKV